MKKDPVKTAQEILKAFGGKENVISATHCATRLRVEVKDASVIDEEAMKDIPGVAGYFAKSGQHQVILGTGFVNKVCAELKKNGVDATVDNRSEKIGYKIREARMDRLPYMLVVGQQEEADGTVSVRSRFAGDEGVKPLAEFINAICEEIRTKQIREEVPQEEK